MLISLSSWYKNSLPAKIEIIRNAIEQKTEIRFNYYPPMGESSRQIEPYFASIYPQKSPAGPVPITTGRKDNFVLPVDGKIYGFCI